MKKALLLLSFVHLLAACTNDIEILPNDESQKLIVNALINANKTNNAIFLALSGYHEPQVVKNGIIHLYINNVLSETISECTYRPNNDSPLDYQNYFYQINSRFKTGDQVRIEVETKDGKYKANAEATVYEPIEIIKADTIESNHSLSETSESLWIYQATKWKIKLQTPTTNHSQYYRVNIKQTYTYHLTNRKTLQDSTAISTQWECSGYYDTALMDGKPGTPNNSDPIINFIPTINNYYNVFNDAYFTNNQYTMTLDSWYSFLLDNKLYKIKKIKEDIQLYEEEKEKETETIKNNDTDWMNIFKKKEKINELNRLLIDEDIVVSEDGNIKVIFKYEDKCFEALDFINKQKYDIILSS